ncbi:hypothetical protein Pcinc_042636 [Petrolisthes cinctipes]|uniref:Uncharacterized protein n=1 Tax=Petrolisthes cinctipes TaxID=88211 RepID=A0AAE1BH32_PETCI|nr:hypothetical protein Pcinc_042636 [Petrolisthes cinctipes]
MTPHAPNFWLPRLPKPLCSEDPTSPPLPFPVYSGDHTPLLFWQGPQAGSRGNFQKQENSDHFQTMTAKHTRSPGTFTRLTGSRPPFSGMIGSLRIIS